nr:RNA polymerase sigma factor region1.1 domain-containing protein [Rappaport israeli]
MSDSDFEREHDEEDVVDEVKELIDRGREQGFLTYEEINDTMPEHSLEGDKFEEIISLMIEMGIDVVETASDSEDVVAPEDTEELPNSVLSNEAEIGRTTDPVRMYMREMGVVDLLTREGEIAIAKRIEAGLNSVQETLADFPLAVSALIEEFQRIEEGEGKLGDLVNGYGDPFADKEIEANEDNEDIQQEESLELEEDIDDDSATSSVNTTDGMTEAREKLLELVEIHKKLMTSLKKGQKLSSKKNKALHNEVKSYMVAFSFPQRTIDLMEERLEDPVEEIRAIERKLMRIIIDRAGMPRKSFVNEFPGNETDLDWVLRQSKQKRKIC